MNMIRCSLDCAYQTQGYCGLDAEAAVTGSVQQRGCVYYKSRQKDLKKNGEHDIISLNITE